MAFAPRSSLSIALVTLSVAALVAGGCAPASNGNSGAGDPPTNPGRPGSGGTTGTGGTPDKTPPAANGAGGSGGMANPDPTPTSPGSGGAPGRGGSGGGGSGGATSSADAADETGSTLPMADAGAGGAMGGAPEGARIADGMTQMLVSRAIGLGYYHACHLLASKDIKCYGTPPTEPRLMPPAIKSDQIFCAHNGCCVLTGGANSDGLADGLEDETGSARLPDGTLGLMIKAKRLTCWGHKNTFFPPAAMDMDPIQFAIGYDHGCVLNADHTVACWGQAGTMYAQPAGLTAKSITVASFFNCAVKMDDSVVCWGVNPPLPPAGLKAKMVAAIFHGSPKLPDAPKGTRHACAIQLDDTVKCWGDNVEGTTDVPADLGPVKDIATATFNSCALKLDGSPVCWGTKKYNEIAERFHPMPAGLHLKGIRSKLAAYCGLQADDTMACWGDESSTHLTIPAGTKFYSAP
jgi:hypothetical protein